MTPRRSVRRTAALLSLLTLAQCSELGPFEGPQPSAEQHSLCYNRASASPEQLHALAVQACGGKAPQFVDHTIDLSACPILVPVRVSFACAA
jgi:hypothetical protein